ncbi:MAG: lipid II:glycine glycyltransferase FemX [Rhodopila sp.]
MIDEVAQGIVSTRLDASSVFLNGELLKSEHPAAQAPSFGALIVEAAEVCIDPAWDDAVGRLPGGDLIQTTRWAATRQQIGMQVHRLRLSAPDGSLLAGALIQCRRIMPGVKIGAVPRGPLLFAEKPGLAGRLMQEMVLMARRAGIDLLIVQPPIGGKEALGSAMRAAGFRPGGPTLAPDASIRIDLRQSEETILRRVHSRRRTHIRNVLRSPLQWQLSDDVATFHALHVESARRTGFRPIELAALQAQWDILAPAGMCQIIEVRDNGVPIEAEWLTCFAGTITSKLKGRAYDKTPVTAASKVAGTAALWYAIRWARSIGAQYFDFGGFDRPIAQAILRGERPGAGLSAPCQIKWSFGGEVFLLPQAEFLLTNPRLQPLFNALVPLLFNNQRLRRRVQRLRRWVGGTGLGTGAAT